MGEVLLRESASLVSPTSSRRGLHTVAIENKETYTGDPRSEYADSRSIYTRNKIKGMLE